MRATVLMVLGLASSSYAAFLNNSTGLATPSKVVTFSEIALPADGNILSTYAGLGVTFSPGVRYNPTGAQGTPYPNFSGVFAGNFGSTNPIAPTFSIRFLTPQTGAAFALATQAGATSVFQALLAGVVQETATRITTYTSNQNYFGFTEITFDEIRITQIPPPGPDFNASAAIDNIQFRQACAANVTIARMSEPNQLHIQVRGEFSPQPSPKSLGVSATIGNKTLTQVFDLSPALSGEQLHSFFFDLPNEGVSRFTDNVRFQIVPKRTENQVSCDGTAGNAIVLLPTILIPGILSSQGGDGTFPLLENHLRSKEQTIPSLLGEPYRLDSDVTDYPTLFTLEYRTNRASFREGGLALDRLVQRIKQLTYADRVNLVGHSKGALVGRWYVTERAPFTGPFPLPSVNQFVMCEAPHTGALKGTWEIFLPGGAFDNLWPLWPWFQPAGQERYIKQGRNPELEQLNEMRLPAGVRYIILYSTSKPTQITQQLGRPRLNDFIEVAGDGIVPAFSMLGLLIDPNDLSLPPKTIPAFEGAAISLHNIPGGHGGYLALPQVITTIAGELIK